MVRRLPVVQTQAPEDELAERRPRWQWTLIGAGLTLTIWLPLLAVALWLSPRLGNPTGLDSMGFQIALTVAPILCAFALAALAAGALVGRFGGRAGLREAALSGALAAVLVGTTALLGGGGDSLALLVAVILLALTSSGSAGLGAWLGKRSRPRV